MPVAAEVIPPVHSLRPSSPPTPPPPEPSRPLVAPGARSRSSQSPGPGFRGGSGLFPSWIAGGLCEPGYVPDFNDLTLLPFCVGLTLLGLIGSWAAWRRRGVAAGTRGVAWSLLPVSLYLTGLLELVWDVVRSTVSWVTHLIFSPTVWAGVALFGVSVVLYVVSGVARGRRGDTVKAPKAEKKPASPAGELTATGPAPASAAPAKAAKPAKGKAKQQESSEFDEIEDI